MAAMGRKSAIASPGRTSARVTPSAAGPMDRGAEGIVRQNDAIAHVRYANGIELSLGTSRRSDFPTSLLPYFPTSRRRNIGWPTAKEKKISHAWGLSAEAPSRGFR